MISSKISFAGKRRSQAPVCDVNHDDLVKVEDINIDVKIGTFITAAWFQKNRAIPNFNPYCFPTTFITHAAMGMVFPELSRWQQHPSV